MLSWSWAAGAAAQQAGNDAGYLGLFPPPQAKGELRLQLHVDPRATEKVVVVSFGVPFGPGCLRDPGHIAIKDSTGVELPIHVKTLAVWPAPAPHAGSLRAVLVQFQDYIATAAMARTYTLTWGAPRKESEPQGWPARQGWLPSEDRAYPNGAVQDPPAFVTLPPEWLSRAMLKGPMLPAGRWPAFEFYDRAMAASFATAAGMLDPQVEDKHRIKYASDHEPWLYDRAMTFFVTYMRRGGLEALAQGHRATQFYAGSMAGDGKFRLLGEKSGADVKYGYQECLLLDYWFTGDERLLEASKRVATLLDAWDPSYSPDRTFWTERHLAIALLNATAGYELTGDPRLLARAQGLFEAGYTLQNNPPPGAPADGCMVHTGRQHGERLEGWICSVWMSSLLVDAMLRYYVVTADERVPRSIEKLADFVVASGTYRVRPHVNEPSDLTFPYYLISSQMKGKVQDDPWGDRQHAIDTALLLAAADYFTRKQGRPKPQYRRLLHELLVTARWNFDKHYRPDGPSKDRSPYFPLSPPRKFNWWFRTTAGLDWFLSQP